MERYKDASYNRNYGYWNEAEQQLICDSNVSIAGVGGDGFQLGLNLVRMGVQNLSVADPEVFEKENSNRVPGAIVRNYGRNKAVVFKEMAEEINPDVKVDVYTDGVSQDNVEDFLRNVNLLIDESELRYAHIGVMLARTARKLLIPNMTVMNIGFAGVATSFDPEAKNTHATLEYLLGISEDVPIDEIKDMKVNLDSMLPYIPGYGDIDVLKAVNDGAPFPSIVQGVSIAAGLGSTQAFLHMVAPANNNRIKPTWASRFLYNDSYVNRSGIIEIPKISHYFGAIQALGRSALGVNPRASYTDSDRKRRDQKIEFSLSPSFDKAVIILMYG